MYEENVPNSGMGIAVTKYCKSGTGVDIMIRRNKNPETDNYLTPT